MHERKRIKRLSVYASKSTKHSMKETEKNEAMQHIRECDGFVLHTYMNDEEGVPSHLILKVCQSVLANIAFVTHSSDIIKAEVSKLIHNTLDGMEKEDGIDTHEFLVHCHAMLNKKVEGDKNDEL